MQQADALAILKTGVNVFLTGEPGAGKSHTIREYVAYLRSHGVEPAITASTGIAATHIGGMTIHSWSGIWISKELHKEEILGRKQLVKRIRSASTLIIDEVSMLSALSLSNVDKVCRMVRENVLPFGGLQVVFVGDFFQLPPVTGRGEAPAEFAFLSDAWRAADPTICYLSEQHRQEDPVFLDLLASMRMGMVTEEHREILNERFARGEEIHDITKLYSHNVDVDKMNATRLAALPGQVSTFAMSSHGAQPLIEQLQRGCLSPQSLQLKKGARVMFTKNHFEEGFVNGTTGEVVGFDHETLYPIVELRSGRRIDVQPDTWAIEVEGKTLAQITQLPLRLAWAMTIHKSQGMSLDAAYIDLSGAFAYGQGYVALSRVRTLDGLHLGGANQRALEVDGDVLAQDERFRAQSEAAENMLAALDVEELTRRHEVFLQSCGSSSSAGPVVKKTKKSAPHEETLKIVRAGKSIAEAAAEQGRTIGTIIEHLEKVRAKGKLSPAEIVHLKGDEDFTEMHLAFAAVGDAHLKPAFEHLGGRYSYDTLRLARLFYVAQ